MLSFHCVFSKNYDVIPANFQLIFYKLMMVPHLSTMENQPSIVEYHVVCLLHGIPVWQHYKIWLVIVLQVGNTVILPEMFKEIVSYKDVKNANQGINSWSEMILDGCLDHSYVLF